MSGVVRSRRDLMNSPSRRRRSAVFAPRHLSMIGEQRGFVVDDVETRLRPQDDSHEAVPS